MKVTRRDYSQDAIKTQELEGDVNEFGLDRAVYAKISSRTDNKTLVAPTGKDSPFERFLIDMEDIHRGNPVTPEVTLLDVYIGNLGETVEYPFKDDTYFSEQWIEEGEQFEFRNVIHAATFTKDDNVIDRDTGLNVIHNTGLQAQILGVRHA